MTPDEAMPKNSARDLVSLLQRAAGLLDDTERSLKAEVIEACDRLTHPTYRIAVFGPFNYGKSTLLNAILGEKALPMDLVPTTGAAIVVKYGPAHRTRITRIDGSVEETEGTAALADYAVLDEQRRMRTDIAAVDVFCPHPLLKLGIELMDLPGTDDQQAQNDLVQRQLLSADLVIQLLDGRKLMTLAEREHLRDWLLDRGINTVIFVVNFLNLLESGDRQQIALRLRFLAEGFRSELPTGVSNLYQVDALPSLRARLKGDMAAAKQTGLPELEAALQTIGAQAAEGRSPEQSLPRLKAIAPKVIEALKTQISTLSTTAQPNEKERRRAQIQQKAQSLISQGFEKSAEKMRSWLVPQTLQAHYRLGLAQALETRKTQDWILENLKPAWYERQKPLVNWVHQACDIFKSPRPAELWIAFQSAEPDPTAPTATAAVPDKNPASPSMAPVAIATGLGWVLGGPLGAAVLGGTSHLINQSGDRSKQDSSQPPMPASNIDYLQQANIYLNRFSEEALQALDTYEKEAKPIIDINIPKPQSQHSAAHEAQLNLLKSTKEELSEQMSQL